MKKRLSQIWQQFQQSFSIEERLNTTLDTGKAVLEAAKTLKEQSPSLEILQSVLQHSSSLLDVLCLPVVQVVDAGLPFASIGIALLKFYRELTQQDPSLEDCVFIVSQTAYLESAKEILSLYPSVDWDGEPNNNEIVRKKLQKLKDFELDYQLATNTIACFHESELAKAFNQVLMARLTTVKTTKYQAHLLTERIAWNTHRYLIKAWIESGEAIKNVIQPSFGYWQQEQQNFQSINEYLQAHIATRPLDKLLDENFLIKEVYIPLKSQPIDKNGSIDKNADALDLDTWAKRNLLKPDNLEQVMFIQGAPGRGKSVFCRIFADWVRQHLHPLWTPILIRLRDIDFFELRLEDILKAELKVSFIQSDDNWLTNKNTRFLFILDGFDELHIEARKDLNLEAFIKQVANFQQDCQIYQSMGHRVLITGRSMALQNISELPRNLERVEISEMDGQLQEKWLKKWSALPDNQGKPTDLQKFLQNKRCPASVQKLAQEPLLLYLLAAMYRDEKLGIDKLKEANARTAKVLIYQEAVNWVLTKQRSEADGTNLNNQITKQLPEDLKRILTEAAVCVVQSGGEFASMSMLEARLEEIEKAKYNLGDESLKTTLAAFYIRPAHQQEGRVEFFHKSFSEFLFAERLKQNMQSWSELTSEDEIKQMNWQIYDLLGFGGLTSAIVEYVIGLLVEVKDLLWVRLFKHLDNFYSEWCQGKFIDDAKETLAQTKLRQLQKYGIHKLGQRQVDIYVGLNVMILLMELQRYGQEHDVLKEHILFYPSGQPEEGLINQLLEVIHYSYCLPGKTFNSMVGQFLSGANLRGVNLVHTDLSYVNLSHADLSRADLSHTNLIRADLSSAYLINADIRGATLVDADLSQTNLIRADLSGADLSYADLSDADLSGAFLSDVNFMGANLSGANFSGANFSDSFGKDIRWNEDTKWENVDGLDIAKNVPAALKQQLGLN
ncbi:putative low-complexity protein [Cylindrospermum stagnale PCC 7417]|uniref:Putative low-complexity protein n=1 Tax=Cylindrospermum stagnale PCC 7417 TaxID=56107 RepID=K9X619_9NOST|nr:pentapeptide repeat-containing protein [Cylindrospermum stagnale]AFZ28085.1 putative low-complexity protein [Cylindrospermum stagnale PCC 7417]